MAMASVSCASRLSEPSDIAPVAKRLTISLAGSTSSTSIPPSASQTKSISPRSDAFAAASPFMCSANSS